MFISEEIQTSIQNDYIDTAEDWELRTPIAPPMTSLEGAKVILLQVHLENKQLELSEN